MSNNEPPPYPGDGPSDDLPAYGSVPPPPGGYPPPPPGGFPPPAPGGHVEPYDAAGAIGYGWRAFKANAGAMVGATAIVFVGTFVVYGIAQAIAPQPELTTTDSSFDLQFDGSALIASLIVQTLVGSLAYLLTAMLVRGGLDITEGRSFSIGDAFSRIPVVPVILTGLLLSVLSTIGIALCILPGVVFAIFSFFTVYFVIDRGENPFTALGSSFRLVGSNFGAGLLTGLLCFLVTLAGFVALLVGLLVAVPIVTVAGAYAYKRFQNLPVAPLA